MRFELEEVPPPAQVPVHQIAETLGLVEGLSAERNSRLLKA